ncbi:putative ATP-dependent DEAD/H RNA helicase [Trypanosoma grayi]|uniref:putative ATP-dependent DEAD/H RNA helicase n=1 Tax=Trypanosoma grayi TaxID=71804 RepID=UPI0004F4428F|nr:putative ATP-dependent DEAD/H RNA helicase [Trypanosoma grayi]KEG12029.1 putative ATP-dependent DEAD/H RNA helicase [Trypanosoma grayi]
MPSGRSRRNRAPPQEPGRPLVSVSSGGSAFHVAQLQQVLQAGAYQNSFVQPGFQPAPFYYTPAQVYYQPTFQPVVQAPAPDLRQTQRAPAGNRGRAGGAHRGNNYENAPVRFPRNQVPINFENVPKASGSNEESPWTKKNLYAMVKAFVDNPDASEMSFPPTLTAAERHMVHQAALNFNLHHQSSGSKTERVLTLRKIGSITEQREQQEVAALDGIRVKTIDGYQGAQMLPDDYVKEKVHEIRGLVKPLLTKMYKHLKATVTKTSRTRHLAVAQPGLNSVPKGNVSPQRYEELQQFRHSLPSYRRKDEIVAAVRNNNVVIVSGDTGCGKTTQIPQLLYDANVFPKDLEIICTQPRRISALSVAHRVSEERGEACGDSCGYVIRFDNMTSSNTKIVYMTTGILLRRLHTDPQLTGVSCVFVDEVHERDVETDFCLLLLRDRLLEQQRNSQTYKNHVKVVVMSATVQIEKVTSYFGKVNAGKTLPVISIPGTLFPVEEHFLEDALKWVNMPPSAVPAMSLLAPASEKKGEKTNGDAGDKWALYEQIKDRVFQEVDRDPEALVPYELVFKLIAYIHGRSKDLTESILVFLPGWASISRVSSMIQRSPIARELSVLQLHSSLTAAEQQRVFYRPPKRYRKVVLSTNIAEASITIDDTVYVIDSCLTKGTSYDPTGNTSSLKATYIGKANGLQRRGRAGRCRAGMCVHLLPKSAYNALPDFLLPEIMRTPLEEVCLQVKALKPDEACAKVLSRALDSPPENSTEHAVRFLRDMGALTHENEQLTSLGRALSKLPIHPLLGKMLLAAACLGVLEPVATISAYLSGKSPFIKPLPHQKNGLRQAMDTFDDGSLSDHICAMNLFNGWKKANCSEDYAVQHFADHATLRSMDRIRRQLLRLVEGSSLLRRIKDPMRVASRHSNNVGLIRMVALWSLYPRIASIEYRAARNRKRPEVFCWDNKNAQFTMGSVLAMRNKDIFADRAFVFYNERMQLEANLTLFDATSVTPVETALCLRELTVRPLSEVPPAFLNDEESKMGPAFPFTLETEEEMKTHAALFFDGDKKIYITSMPVALAVREVRECMDYYLALAIKEVRADLFPEELTQALAYTVGYPLKEGTGADVGKTPDNTTMASGENARTEMSIANRGGSYWADDSVDEEEAPEITMDDFEDFQLTEEEMKRAAAELGELALFNRYGGARLLGAFQKGEELRQGQLDGQKSEKDNNTDTNEEEEDSNAKANDVVDDDDDDDSDDVIVAQAGELVIDEDRW